MQDVNVSVITGRLTKNCTFKTFDSGSKIINFSVAVNGYKKTQNGYENCVDYFDVEYTTKQNIEEYLLIGKAVSVEGKLKNDSWEKDGKKYSKVYIKANTVNLLSVGNKPTTSQPSETPKAEENQGDSVSVKDFEQAFNGSEEEHDFIPF